MSVFITFANGFEVTADRNVECYITDSRPDFSAADFSAVTVSDAESETLLHNAELIECASIDGRYWFTLREMTAAETELKELRGTVQMLTGCVLEMSEILYA